jgi:hypothetical protein
MCVSTLIFIVLASARIHNSYIFGPAHSSHFTSFTANHITLVYLFADFDFRSLVAFGSVNFRAAILGTHIGIHRTFRARVFLHWVAGFAFWVSRYQCVLFVVIFRTWDLVNCLSIFLDWAGVVTCDCLFEVFLVRPCIFVLEIL